MSASVKTLVAFDGVSFVIRGMRTKNVGVLAMNEMQCSSATRLGIHSLPSGTRVCERAPTHVNVGDVFINALHADMPECDRASHSATLRDLKHAPHCYVYCAQRSCGAAKEFMIENADEIEAKCDEVTYLHNGALGMHQSELKDGATCHANVVAHNTVQEVGCLNCDGRSTVDVGLTVNGEERAGAQYLAARPSAPEWFKRSSIWSRHPPQFSCDARYANPPQTHDPSGSERVRLDTTGTGIQEDAKLAFWASKPDERVREAHAAYGDFSNSGITQCNRHTCEFTVDAPGAYTADGTVFRPHIHVSEWKGDHWGSVATVTLGDGAT